MISFVSFFIFSFYRGFGSLDRNLDPKVLRNQNKDRAEFETFCKTRSTIARGWKVPQIFHLRSFISSQFATDREHVDAGSQT